jgi:hypothetical protein
MKFTKPEISDYIRSIVYILLYVVLIGGGAFYLLPGYWYFWVVLVVGGLVLLVSWHRGETVYQCPNCSHVYEILFWVDLISPHGVDKDGGWLSLRCPHCKQRSKTRVMKRVE